MRSARELCRDPGYWGGARTLRTGEDGHLVKSIRGLQLLDQLVLVEDAEGGRDLFHLNRCMAGVGSFLSVGPLLYGHLGRFHLHLGLLRRSHGFSDLSRLLLSSEWLQGLVAYLSTIQTLISVYKTYEFLNKLRMHFLCVTKYLLGS